MYVRDYAKEYQNYHGTKQQLLNRCMRNKARRECMKQGRVAPGDGKHVDHRVPLSKGGTNDPKNWRVLTARGNLRKGSTMRSKVLKKFK